MKRLGHSQVDLLRMDVEGAEFDVLSSLPYDKIHQLSVEIHMWSRSFENWKAKLMKIPLHHSQTYQNTDTQWNKKTMQQIRPGITRVYEMTFSKTQPDSFKKIYHRFANRFESVKGSANILDMLYVITNSTQPKKSAYSLHTKTNIGHVCVCVCFICFCNFRCLKFCMLI